MRIKLSKQNWRLVGQKMGWLKRAQITTGAGGVTSTGAAEAMGLDKEKADYDSMETNDEVRGRVDNGMKYKESPFDPNSNIRLHQGIFTDSQYKTLGELSGMNNIYLQYIEAESDWKDLWFRFSNKKENPTIDDLRKGFRSDIYYFQKMYNDTRMADAQKSPGAQSARFEGAFNAGMKKLQGTMKLVENAFLSYIAKGKPQPSKY